MKEAVLRLAILVFSTMVGSATCEAQVYPANAETVDYGALNDLPDWRGLWLPMAGATSRGEAPRLNSEYQERRSAEGVALPRASNCLPPGMPRVMTQPYSVEFLFTPGRVTIIQEAYMQVRRVFTDGRPLPEAPDPTFNGYSTGHWEGDTLVIETIAIKDAVPLTSSGARHGPDLKIIERIYLDENDADRLRIDFTLEDPDALAEPWHTSAIFRRNREWDQLEFVCAENDRNPVGADGETQFILGE